MSGHSHWATIKRKKGASDARKGQVYTRLAREIAMAAREGGGGDPDSNFRLRIAVEKARAENMPKESVDRAIKRGTGESKDGVVFEQVFYEGYAPHAVALMIECVTENRNRTVAELRHALSRSGGNLGEAGSVGWQFTRTAYFSVPSTGKNFDQVFEVALEGGANDIIEDEGNIEVFAPVEAFKKLSDAFRGAGIRPQEAELRQIANQEIEVDVDKTLQVMRTIEGIEDLDDVQNVFSNLKISEEAMAAMDSA
jgi:YebC/PmpR family DNA-binding regulatory protein